MENKQNENTVYRQQHIEGNNNQQAGRDINNYSVSKLDLSNPNMIECPQCWNVTGRYSSHCIHCNYEVKNHFDEIGEREYELKRKERQIKLNNNAMLIGLGGILTSIGGAKFELPILMIAGMVVALLAGAVLNAANGN